MNGAVLVCLITLVFCVRNTYGEQRDALRIIEEVDLEDALKTGGSVTVMAGEGLSLRLLTKDQKVATETKRQLVVFYKGRKVKSLLSSHYLSYTKLEAGIAKYWMIEEYTGGVHCCTRYHFFARPEPKSPLKYLGATRGSEGETPYYEGAFIFRNGEVYFEDVDIRFVYFHTSYTDSNLFIPCFYHLAPSSIRIDNKTFKDRYLKEAHGVEDEIKENLDARNTIPQAILIDGSNNTNFSDKLGQLLIKRTILYLYAREDNKAWETLERDIKKYYKTTRGLKTLKREIGKILKENPY